MADPLPDYPHKPLPFAEAIAWAKARRVVLPEVYYGPLQGLARSMSFSIAGLTKLSQLELVMKSLESATADGQSFATWKKRVKGGEINLDLPAYRVENIFRTNLQGHYNRGRCEQQKANAENQPYLMYDATNDSRTRPSHAAMDGFVAPIDDPTWNVWRTPCGYQCRCRTIALSPRQAERFRKADDDRLGRDRDAFDNRMESLTGGPDKGWDYDLCAKPTEGLRRAWDAHVGKSHPLLKGVTEAAKVATEVQAAAIAAEPTWPMLVGREADLDDIKALGAERLEELLNYRIPRDADNVPIMSKGKAVRDLIEDGDFINHNRIASHVHKKLLADIAVKRSVGGKFATTNQRGKAVDVTQRVADKLPSSWISEVNAGGEYTVIINETARGWHKQYSRKISTSSGSTAEHEWMHAVQTADPVLDKLFQDEHRRRTAGDPLRWLGEGYGRNEKARADKYIDAYQGREYREGEAKEVITMAMQAILGEGGFANSMLEEMIRKDPDMVKLALGVLFHYRPKL